MNQVLDAARQKFLINDGTVPWTSAAAIKMALVDLDAAGPAAGGWIISALTYSTTTFTATTATAHGLSSNDWVAIQGVAGFTGGGANPSGNYQITVTDTTHFTFTVASAPTGGSYTANSGRIFGLSKTFVADALIASGASVARSSALTSVVNNAGSPAAPGTAGAANGSFASAGAITIAGQILNNTAEGLFIYMANPTGGADNADSACRIIYWIDTATGLPVTPNGGAVNVNWASQGIFRL